MIESPRSVPDRGRHAARILLFLLEFSEPRRLRVQLAALKQVFRCGIVPGTNPHLELLREELGDYFAGRRTTFTVPT